MKKQAEGIPAGGLKAVWYDLNQSIYVGDRLKENLSAMTFVSLFCAFLGLVLIISNVFIRHRPLASTPVLMSFVTFAAGAGAFAGWAAESFADWAAGTAGVTTTGETGVSVGAGVVEVAW